MGTPNRLRPRKMYLGSAMHRPLPLGWGCVRKRRAVAEKVLYTKRWRAAASSASHRCAILKRCETAKSWQSTPLGRIHPKYLLQPIFALKTPDILQVPLNQQRLLLVVADGRFMDGSVCPLWNERGRPGTIGNFGWLVPLSDFHDYGRDAVWCSDGRMETKPSFWSISAKSRATSFDNRDCFTCTWKSVAKNRSYEWEDHG
jgi:hypothetical protein